jgi:hypothetical protein
MQKLKFISKRATLQTTNVEVGVFTQSFNDFLWEATVNVINVSGTYLVVVGAMFDFLSIEVDGVVVIARVHDKTSPFPPSGRDVTAVVLVQVLAKIPCKRHTRHFKSCRRSF